MKNKKNKLLILFWGVFASLFSSCTDFLEPYPNGNIDEEEFWKHQELVQGLIGQCYEYMDRNYDNNNGYYLDGATDDAVITSTTHSLSMLAVGSLTTNGDPFKEDWTDAYKAIGLVNRFLYQDRGYNTRYLTDARLNDILRTRLQGEAYALRAWYQWELLRKWGGIGIDSKQLLGFPIVTEPIDIFDEKCNLSRNTYAKCVEQIIADCDLAIKYLPIAHRDFLVDNPSDLLYSGGKYWGRLDGITMKALKANLYLTWASPLFNSDNDQSRWQKAAEYAQEVIRFKQTVDNVKGGFNASTPVSWTDPNFPGIVFGSRWNDNSDSMERAFYPAGFQGNGAIGATQELVDAFPMSNGYPKEHPKGRELFDESNPYSNRDPRFYSTIFYNGAEAKRDNKSETMYTFETWANDATGVGVGKDAPGGAKNSRTGYHIKKYVYMGLNWSDVKPRKGTHSKFYIRWAHMVLAYAEAMNELYGPLERGTFDLSAKEAMSLLRSRPTYDNEPLYKDADPYLDEIASNGKDEFRKFIHNENRIEKCFEGLRFYDIRRWSKATEINKLNQSIHKVVVEKKEDGSYGYDYSQVIENRSYPSLFLPIPYTEVLRMSKMEQNIGWDNWK